jgi:Family of unknown function (DUF6459)
MPTPSFQPPGAQPPGARPGWGPGGGRRGCPRVPGPPLPDPDAVRVCHVPDSAPPYDDELLSRPARAGQPDQTGGHDQDARPDQGWDREHNQAGDDVPPPRGGRPAPADGAWPGQFAQVLVETLAGSRPPRQISSWATERARARIQRLGPMLAAGQRPQLRRVVAFRPASDVIEMTVVVSFGPRVRALAVRLEHSPPPRALPGLQPRKARWLCTEVEAA